ncbi:MAG TPA: arsenate reductase ArsC [Candidatus Binatia bacterium]|nr:arsenate reductase ArsC [Candidatus Binatia bacterium]
MKRNVLFICVHNSARSQMAEAFLNELCANDFTAESAGLEPGTLSPFAVAAMGEIGVDISSKKTKGVFDLFKAGRLFSYVITVCDETSAQRCPIFPGQAQRLHWSFPDPADAQGSWADRLAETRRIRDDIRAKIVAWCGEACGPTDSGVGGAVQTRR